MSGRFPLLSVQVNVAQFVVQSTRNRWPGVDGALASKPSSASPSIGAVVVVGSMEMPRMGRFGSTVLLPVTLTHVACDAVPVPRLKPICTLPSFVPAIATAGVFGAYFTWLMNERLPSVCLVRFCVDGLFVTYHVTVPFAFAALPVIVSHTRVVPATRCPQPPLAPAAGQSVPPTIPPRKMSNGRMNDCVSLPQPPFLLVHVAPLAVQLEMQRDRPQLLLPCQKRRLVPVPTGSMRE